MGTSQNQGVNVNINQFCQIPSGNFICDRVLKQSFFHQGDEEGACFALNGHILVQFFYVFGIDTAFYGGFRGNDPNASVPCDFRGNLSAGPDYANDGHIRSFFQKIQGVGAGSIAGDHNGFYLKSPKKSHNLF